MNKMTKQRQDNALARPGEDQGLADFLWTELNIDIGASLRKAREARGMLQAEVAKLMRVQQSRVSQIETTKGVSMTLDVLARYVAALGYRLDVDIRDPDNDALVSNVPVVPMTFMAVEEVERRSHPGDIQVAGVGEVTVKVSRAESRSVRLLTDVETLEAEGEWMRSELRNDGKELAAAA